MTVHSTIQEACETIAPTWPLDRFIAVNPFWQRTARSVADVAAELASLSGATLLMPRAWYAQAWREGRLRPEHLREALARRQSATTEDELVALLERPVREANPRQTVLDVADGLAARNELTAREVAVTSISQFCAAYFDDGQAHVSPSREGGLYAAWKRYAKDDRAPEVLIGLRDARVIVRSLPDSAEAVIDAALRELQVPEAQQSSYLQSLLLSINGWASWCAYRRWLARLAANDDDHIVDLLGMRIAWELMVFRSRRPALASPWTFAMSRWPTSAALANDERRQDWLLQEALEIAYQTELARALTAAAHTPAPRRASVQAVFCIDVRSEVFRRAFEAESTSVQTLGFAGFFGLPIDYMPSGAVAARPQLPGLLTPRYRATDTNVASDTAHRRSERLHQGEAWRRFSSSPISGFSFVDAVGMFYAGKLFAESGGWSTTPRAGVESPRIVADANGAELTVQQRCDLAENMLRGMSLTRDFARLVLLVGHGSVTRNNPHAAGLDCGACCGQTGEVNARVAAALLNDREVRQMLAGRGIVIGEETHFVAGLHDTTVDHCALLELEQVPPGHRAEAMEVVAMLSAAGVTARRERAASLRLEALPDVELEAALVRRSRDWSEVRPEWGLARNAALIVARRERTRHIDLRGRAFLHEYRFEDDPRAAILELIMTAPMVVAHWINFQYYASTVDNARYGSGNKVLHNVVGGHLGVFEGNGGDLRIGLPLQCLHDGERWVHEPLRLSVYIEAPRSAIEGVLEKHAKVRELVQNEWLSLFQLDGEERAVHQWSLRGWRPVTT